MPKIVLEHVTKRWGNYYGVDDLNLVIDDNSFITLLGPSGCGKTTTLRMIAGLETPTSGRITIGDTVVFDSQALINVPASKRRVGFLFQNYALWPNMTVYQNISFGLKNIKEELPLIDFTHLANAQKISVLKDHLEELTAFAHELEAKSKDKKDMRLRAYTKIVDAYQVSMMSAKYLASVALGHKAAEEISRLIAENAAIEQKYAAKGIALNEKGELCQGEKVLTKVRKLSDEEVDLAVRRVARVVKVGEFMDRYPAELSGGQQQRVAIARTLAPGPKVLFMDEPLSNLDAKLRLEMRSELKRLHADTGATFVYVTHDQLEAMTLATKICLINNGVLQQYDPPLEIYHRPANLFTADFIGTPSINLVEAKGKVNASGQLELDIWDGHKVLFTPREKGFDLAAARQAALANVRAETPTKANKDGPFNYTIPVIDNELDTGEEKEATAEDFVLGIRSEYLTINGGGTLDSIVYSAMPTGKETTIRLEVGNYLLTGDIFGAIDYPIGAKVELGFSGHHVMLFDRKTQKLLTLGALEVAPAKPKRTAAKAKK